MRSIIRASAAGVALLAIAAASGHAQAVNACYVPIVGALYLIGQPGLPAACLAAGHTQVALGGVALPDASVTTAKLQDAAVTSAKLAPGAVTSAEIAANAITGAHIVSGAVGSTDIAADAVGASQIAAAAVGSTELANGAVTTAKLAAPVSIVAGNLANVNDVPIALTSLGSITIIAPAPGRIWITLTGFAVFFGDNTELHIGLGTAAAAVDLHVLGVGNLDGSTTLRYEHAFAPTAVVNVAAGVHTFYATGGKPAFSANPINLRNLKLVAMYIPN